MATARDKMDKISKKNVADPLAAGMVALEHCFHVLEERCLDEEGLYRLSGVGSKVQRLFHEVFERGRFQALSAPDCAPRTITSAVKKFLGSFAEPIIPSTIIAAMFAAVKQPPAQRPAALGAALESLQPPNVELLRTLLQHLSKVAAHSAANKMSPTNLGVVFGPTLMQVRPEDMAQILNCNVVVEALIVDHAAVFAALAGNAHAAAGPAAGPAAAASSTTTPAKGASPNKPAARDKSGAPPPRPAPCRNYVPRSAQDAPAAHGSASAPTADPGTDAAPADAALAAACASGTVLYDFDGRTEGELTIRAGERVFNIAEMPTAPGWLYCMLNSAQYGLVPATYVQLDSG